MERKVPSAFCCRWMPGRGLFRKPLIGGLWLGLLLSVVLLLTAAGYADYDGFHAVRMRFYGTDGPVSPLHRFFASDSGNLHGFGAASAGFDRQQLLYGYHDPADRDQLHGAQAVQGIGDLDHHPFWRSHLWGGLFAGLGLLLEKLVLLHLGGLWLLFAGLGLLWAFAYILYWGCARMMDRKINLS